VPRYPLDRRELIATSVLVASFVDNLMLALAAHACSQTRHVSSR
jgi:hypothetical protein